MLELAFERDLRTWITRVYERRAGMVRSRMEEQVSRILDGERRWLVPLMVGVWVGIAGMFVVGPGSLVAGLVVLYIGALFSGFSTMRRAEKVQIVEDPRPRIAEMSERGWQERPALGVEERARLVRIMNLDHTPVRPRASSLLLEEVGEALREPPLSEWRVLADYRDLLVSGAERPTAPEGGISTNSSFRRRARFD